MKLQPVEYDMTLGTISLVSTPVNGEAIGIVEPVTGYGRYTHLVKTAEGTTPAFALASLTQSEEAHLPVWDYGTWLDQQGLA